MNNKRIDIINILLAIAAIVLALLIYKGCSDHKGDSTQRQTEIINTPVQHYTDDAGNDHAVKPVADADLYALVDQYQKIIDSQAALLKVKPKAIKQVAAVGTVTTATIKKSDPVSVNGTAADYETPCHDDLTFQDDWANIKVKKDSEGSWSVDYKTKDSVVLTQYTRKKGWFKKELYLDGYSLNPHTTITGLSNIKITEGTPRRFGIGPTLILTTSDGKRWRPVIGVGIQYNLIRF